MLFVTSPRLAIGPSNFAGQAHAWAHAVETNLGVPAESFARGPIKRGEFRFQTDREIFSPLYFTPLLRKPRLKHLLKRCTHVALDGYSIPFQLRNRRDMAGDARFLTDAGFSVALVAHGGEIRDPYAHQERNEFSMFNECEPEWTKWVADRAAHNREVAQDSGLPLFVSTPDLLHDLPTAQWLPICVDPSEFANDEPLMERAVPRVLHMPSKRNPPIKGSQYVDPLMRKLHDEGLIEYVTPGHMKHSEVPAVMASADIVIDQLLSASYGVTSLEAMASGRVTITAVSEETISLMPARPPMVDATPDTLEQVVRDLVADRDRAREIASEGAEFVRTWHDGRHSANQMADYLGVSER